MRIETKLNIGDFCYYMEDNKIVKGIVEGIEIKVGRNSYLIRTEIGYLVKKDISSRFFSNDEIFTTEEEIIEYLKENKDE